MHSVHVPPREVVERSREASGAGGSETLHARTVFPRGFYREVFERRREASGAGDLETQHARTVFPRGLFPRGLFPRGLFREVFERSREASGAEGLETQHTRGQFFREASTARSSSEVEKQAAQKVWKLNTHEDSFSARLLPRGLFPRGLRVKSRSKRRRRFGNSTHANALPARSSSEVEKQAAQEVWKLYTRGRFSREVSTARSSSEVEKQPEQEAWKLYTRGRFSREASTARSSSEVEKQAAQEVWKLTSLLHAHERGRSVLRPILFQTLHVVSEQLFCPCLDHHVFSTLSRILGLDAVA
jgi:hypothetical protein